jgi:predicted TIM-barrel fold metal-dependent hydrolase
VFDAHVHLNDVPMQLALMDEYGIDRAVVFWGRLSDNQTVVEAVARYPQRFVAFASISPERSAYRRMWQADDVAIVEHLDELLATGRYKGIGEISVVHDAAAGFVATDFDPESAVMRGIVALARKYHVPVMVHCETTRMAQLSRLLEAFPDVAVIWAHGGYTALPEARAMLERHPNLYYELSARTWPRHPRSAAYTMLEDGVRIAPGWLALIESMPRRFLVGSDASHHSEAAERMKLESVRNFLGQLSPTARAEVASGTLRRLLSEN